MQFWNIMISSSRSGHRMPQLTAAEDELLARTPTEELLSLEILQLENIKDTLHAYQMAKRCNEKRVQADFQALSCILSSVFFRLIDKS